MSSSPLSSKNNTFVSNQAQNFNRQNSNLTSPMNLNRHSPGPPSSTATRIIGPKPFYRSRVTPDPYDYTNHHRQENDYQQHLENQFPRRGSVTQADGKGAKPRGSHAWDCSSLICRCMMHVWLILANDGEFDSSDESLSIEFPPPPNEFSSSPVSDPPYQFVPVKQPFAQTTIARSDSGTIELLGGRFYSFDFYIIASIVIRNLS